jgi:UDP-glucose 4-epimerase
MKILITGSSGFLGNYLCKNLIGQKITGVDKSINCMDGCDYFFTNLLKNSTELENIISGIDLVIHLASPVGVENIDKNSYSFLNEMLKINLNLFNLVSKYNKKIIFFSTSEVYLNNSNAKEDHNLTIGSPNKLRWGYASGKLTSEFLCKSLCKNNIIVRPFNITGVGDNKGVLYNFMNSIKNNRNITIHGSGNQIRAFCDIKDLCNFLSKILDKNFNGEIYNIGNTKNSISIKKLAEKCIKLSTKNIKVEYKNYSDIFSKNYSDILMRIPNCDKMDKIYKAKFSLNHIIKSML